MDSFTVRFIQDDIDDKLPDRFKKALKKMNEEQAPIMRALIRAYTKEVEAGNTRSIASTAARKVAHQ